MIYLARLWSFPLGLNGSGAGGPGATVHFSSLQVFYFSSFRFSKISGLTGFEVVKFPSVSIFQGLQVFNIQSCWPIRVPIHLLGDFLLLWSNILFKNRFRSYLFMFEFVFYSFHTHYKRHRTTRTRAQDRPIFHLHFEIYLWYCRVPAIC